MPRALQYLSFGYRALLWLYPRDFRDAYGAEMTDVFERQLQSEQSARGAPGILVTGWYAIRELFTIALPGRLLSERTIATCLSLVIAAALFLSLTALLQDRALAKWIDHTFLVGANIIGVTR